MYPYSLPHTVSNKFGETIIFKEEIEEDGEMKMITEGIVKPDSGTVMHVHFKQDEGFTVVKGKMGYQIKGEEAQFLEVGESCTFPRGQMHKFWCAGEEDLYIKGWLKPANSLDYFLTKLYASMDKAGKESGDPFDSAFLITKYKSEYDVDIIPTFVKKVVMPITVFIGKLLGKYKHFEDAPDAIK